MPAVDAGLPIDGGGLGTHGLFMRLPQHRDLLETESLQQQQPDLLLAAGQLPFLELLLDGVSQPVPVLE